MTDTRTIQPTGRFVADPVSGAAHFVHPCGVCGNPVAPFGYGVHLRRAIETGDARLAGRWLCAACRASGGTVT